MSQILLSLPPFFMGGKPSIILSTLKSTLNNQGISSEVYYANLLFKKMTENKSYESFSVLAKHNAFQKHLEALFPYGRNSGSTVETLGRVQYRYSSSSGW